jgi:DNA-binding response OmpR family regulator
LLNDLTVTGFLRNFFSLSILTLRVLMSNRKILTVEDDPNLLATLKYNLEKDGYDVVTAVDGAEAIKKARQEKPDLIILDIMLPILDGFEVCRILRKEITVPILMLTAKTEETDKIVGLEIGADDYMTKPFSMRELLARVRVIFRRARMKDNIPDDNVSPLKLRNLEIDPARHTALLNDNALSLTPKEFDLLYFLIKNKGIVFNREQLLEKVWGYDYAGNTRTVDVHIRWLRKKLEADPQKPRYLITVRGTGYKLDG